MSSLTVRVDPAPSPRQARRHPRGLHYPQQTGVGSTAGTVPTVRSPCHTDLAARAAARAAPSAHLRPPAEPRLGRGLPGCRGVGWSRRAEPGEAGTDAALVVLGSRGYGRVVGALLGSVAFAVATRSAGPPPRGSLPTSALSLVQVGQLTTIRGWTARRTTTSQNRFVTRAPCANQTSIVARFIRRPMTR